jgi:hypothetical protein
MVIVGFAYRAWRRTSLAGWLYCSRQHDRQLGAERGVIREYKTSSRVFEGSAVGIERTEYDARQAAARELAREHGFSALIAWSRGGSTQDHYADVYYLTGFYTHQPFIPMSLGAGARTATLRWCSPWIGRGLCWWT